MARSGFIHCGRRYLRIGHHLDAGLGRLVAAATTIVELKALLANRWCDRLQDAATGAVIITRE
jgi:hypothetical protein